MAKTLSSMLDCAATATGRWAEATRGPAPGFFGAGAETFALGAPPAGGRGAEGAFAEGAFAEGAFAAGAFAAGAAAVGAGLAAPGPPAGMAGSLIVGDAVGFGGNEIRTVSFLGATFEASEGFGGTF